MLSPTSGNPALAGIPTVLEAEYGFDSVKQIQKTLLEPWRSKPELTVQEILIWVLLRKSMQAAGDVARKEVFDRIEGGRLSRSPARRADRSRLLLTI
jgi:hypothetical protein